MIALVTGAYLLMEEVTYVLQLSRMALRCLATVCESTAVELSRNVFLHLRSSGLSLLQPLQWPTAVRGYLTVVGR